MAGNQILLNRLKKELQILKDAPPTGIQCVQDKDSIKKFHAVIIGEEGTVYENGFFNLEVNLPDRYPFEPPKIQFITKIYHPNIDTAGRICLDLLKIPPSGSWKPAHNLCSLLSSIRILMAAPNPDDPLMADIAEEYKLRKMEFEAKAKEMTEQFASHKIN